MLFMHLKLLGGGRIRVINFFQTCTSTTTPPSRICIFVSATHEHSYRGNAAEERGGAESLPNAPATNEIGLCAHNASLVLRHCKKDDGKISLGIGVEGVQNNGRKKDAESALFH